MEVKKPIAYIAMALIYLGTAQLSTLFTFQGNGLLIKFVLPVLVVLIGISIAAITLFGVK